MDANLHNYIKDALNTGHKPEDIKQALLMSGWQQADVNQAISLIQLQNQAPVPAPAQSAAPVPTVPPGMPIAQTAPAHSAAVAKPSLVSPYTYLLEVVLFFALLILANKAVSDIHTHFPQQINIRLIYDSLIVVPFLLAATVLHLSFIEKKEKFRSLSEPYYLVSGWLIIRLLWNVSQFILDKNAVYGVYVVLILVIAVLTGIVFFIQKYLSRHN